MSIVAQFICQSCGFKLTDPNQECVNCGYKQIALNTRGLMRTNKDKLVDKIRKILNVTNDCSNSERAEMIEAVCGVTEKEQRIEELASDYTKLSKDFQDVCKKNLLLKNELNELKEESVKVINELRTQLAVKRKRGNAKVVKEAKFDLDGPTRAKKK